MRRAMVLATRVECNEESNVLGGKSDGNEGGMQLMVTRAMVTVMGDGDDMGDGTVMRLAGDEEGKGEGGKGDGDGDEGGGQ